jgi:hypothetical protein
MLYNSAVPSDPDVDSLPSLPSSKTARKLVDAVFLYVQARYCIVDWAQVREWHRDRESLAYISNDAPAASQTGEYQNFLSIYASCRETDIYTGAYFIWIIYAIGARFVANPEHSSEVLNP